MMIKKKAKKKKKKACSPPKQPCTGVTGTLALLSSKYSVSIGH